MCALPIWHDRMYWVDLPSGVRVKSRIAGDSPIRLGDHVRIQVQGPVAVFPHMRDGVAAALQE